MPLTVKKVIHLPQPITAAKHPIPEKVKTNQDNTCCLPDLAELFAFTREWNEAINWAGQYRVLRVWWTKVSNEEMPKAPGDLIYARIGYELQAKAYDKAGIVMPKKVAKSLAAIRRWDIEGLAPGIKSMLKIMINHNQKNQQGESDMVKVKKAGANKKGAESKRVNVNQFYLEIFENQAKAQLTDDQIADVIEKKAGSRPSAKNVASYRCMYNAGKLAGQKTVPAKVKAVRPKKEPKAKKPMSEETKAKLKAYTEKKKAAKKAKAAAAK